eukprot:3371_1
MDNVKALDVEPHDPGPEDNEERKEPSDDQGQRMRREASRSEAKSDPPEYSEEEDDHLVIDIPAESSAEKPKVFRGATFGQQFKALMTKTWILKRRHYFWTFLEVFLPILFIIAA